MAGLRKVARHPRADASSWVWCRVSWDFALARAAIMSLRLPIDMMREQANLDFSYKRSE